jgi:DNA polymerase-3 subunit delta'
MSETLETTSHAVLFEGPDSKVLNEALKFSIKIFGQEHKEKIMKMTHSDLAILPSNENKASIGISEIREINKNVFLKPIESKFKVYIIKNSEKLTEQAQNALLKILEEPPKNTVFILLCMNSRLLLPTVLSRLVVKNLSEMQKSQKIAISAANKLIAAFEAKNTFEVLEVFAPFLNNREIFKETLQEVRSKIISECRSLFHLEDLLKRTYEMATQNANLNLLSCFIAAKTYDLLSHVSERKCCL